MPSLDASRVVYSDGSGSRSGWRASSKRGERLPQEFARSTLASLLVIVAIGLQANCTPSTVRHDPEAAARAAVAFVKVALFERDVERSYALLSDSAKNDVSIEKYREAVARMHPSSFPRSLTATEFEPIPGQRVVSIFFRGENGEEQFFYRVAVEAISRDGYRVLGIYRGRGPYPPTPVRSHLKQPLPAHAAPAGP